MMAGGWGAAERLGRRPGLGREIGAVLLLKTALLALLIHAIAPEGGRPPVDAGRVAQHLLGRQAVPTTVGEPHER